MEQQNIVNRLDKIEKLLREIQENMVIEEVILSKEERKMIDESFEHEKAGELVSLEEIKNVRNKAG
jgi:restriction endonuclease S subunit